MSSSLDEAAVRAALRASKGKLKPAARSLGCSRRTLQNRMREYGIPQGRPGRPKKKLSYRGKSRAWAIGTAAVVAGAGYLAFRGRGSQT